MSRWEEHVDGMVLRMDDLDGNVVATATMLHQTGGQARAWLEEIRWAMVGSKHQQKPDEHLTTWGRKGYRSGD